MAEAYLSKLLGGQGEREGPKRFEGSYWVFT